MRVVLSSVKSPNRQTNPFIPLLERSLVDSRVVYFSWLRAFFTHYNVFHVHWPENLFRASSIWRLPKAMFAWLLLLKLIACRVPIVWTVHNEQPHESGGIFERAFLRTFERCVDHRIVMSHAQRRSQIDGAVCSVIPHGHYRPWLADHARSERVSGRILFWGIIRPYKGVEGLISCFRSLSSSIYTLRLVGKPNSPEFKRNLLNSIDGDPRIAGFFDYADDALLVSEISESVLTVLPYKKMGNSGVVLFSLSLERPVLIPDSAYARELRDRVGADWVYIFEGELTPDALEQSLFAAERVVGRAPDLRGYNWEAIGCSYDRVFANPRSILRSQCSLF